MIILNDDMILFMFTSPCWLIVNDDVRIWSILYNNDEHHRRRRHHSPLSSFFYTICMLINRFHWTWSLQVLWCLATIFSVLLIIDAPYILNVMGYPASGRLANRLGKICFFSSSLRVTLNRMFAILAMFGSYCLRLVYKIDADTNLSNETMFGNVTG